jgi:TorA maturation chaperone TorD
MLNRTEEVSELLTARLYLYTLFQSLLGNEPSTEQLQAIDIELAEEAFEIMLSEKADEPVRLLKLFEKTDIAALKGEYTRLFVGPHALKAPPWESVYITKDKMLFTKETLKVRNFYRSQGFIPAEYPHVADDHIAIELDFMAQLALRLQNAAETGDDEVYRETQTASSEFLQDHLLAWIPKYLEDLQEDTALFYPQAAEALLVFLQKDSEHLRAILSP